MQRKVSYIAAMVIVMALVVGVYLTGRTYDAPQASAASGTTTTIAGTTTTAGGTTTATGPGFSAFYLDIGASASLGFQPNGIPKHDGRRTSTGYANDLVEQEGYAGTQLTLRQVGCPGETVQSMISTTMIDHCYAQPEGQMTAAVTYLHENQGTPGVVTIDLGFNNIRTCLSPVVVDEGCVNAAVAAVQVDMPKIVKELKAAAGSNVRFVGLEYNDPFLSHFLDGAAGPDDATATLVAMDKMNAALGQAFSANGVAIANVPALFQTDNTTRVTVANVGVIPENVEEACELTWMCYGAPFGPDDHPNDAGYALIATAIADELPRSW